MVCCRPKACSRGASRPSPIEPIVAALIDTHLHLYRDEFDEDRDAVRRRAIDAGVGAFVHIGYDAATNELALETARADPAGWATAGLHPHDAENHSESIEAWIADRAREGAIVAIGECGLDYYRDLSPRPAQQHSFRRQIALAHELDLPMIHHVRDAYDDAKAILIEAGLPPRRGIFHAFAGDAAFARWAVDEGYKLGIGGVFTYKKAHLPEAIAGLPAEAIQLETDAPWLPPQPWRGKRNEPAFARHSAEAIAASLGLSVDAASEIWSREFESLFRCELGPSHWDVVVSEHPLPIRERSRKSK